MWVLTTLILIIVPAFILMLLKVLQMSFRKHFTEGEGEEEGARGGA